MILKCQKFLSSLKTRKNVNYFKNFYASLSFGLNGILKTLDFYFLFKNDLLKPANNQKVHHLKSEISSRSFRENREKFSE